ncbi:hypothetical protein [Tardiphaga sp.]|jgi:hypothetical protein|uniref:hypothetical protein n=1 Tax=Tardiphaga sp. TaxID=1926292 RepID=UPI0037DA0C2A
MATAALAFKETTEIYSGGFGALSARGESSYLTNIRRSVDDAERMLNRRKSAAIEERRRLATVFKDMHKAGEITTEVLTSLDLTISAVSAQATEQADAVEAISIEAETLLAQVRALRIDEYKAVRKEIARFLDYGKVMHSDIVDMYYFLLSLKNEYAEPTHSEVAATFDSASDVRAFLKASLAG